MDERVKSRPLGYNRTVLTQNWGAPAGEIVYPMMYSGFLNKFIPMISLLGEPMATVTSDTSG